jgi:hypothetical protein
VIIQTGYHGAHHHTHADAHVAKFSDQPESLVGGCCSWFHFLAKFFFGSGNGNKYGNQFFFSQFFNDVFIPKHAGILGDHSHGLVEFQAYLK